MFRPVPSPAFSTQHLIKDLDSNQIAVQLLIGVLTHPVHGPVFNTSRDGPTSFITPLGKL